jgi:hypothetical protein
MRLLRAFAVLLTFLLGLELLLRLLPVSTATLTGYPHDPDLLVYPPGHRWQVATGWDLRNAQRLRANNMGFAAERDFVPDPQALALIGDSFVEASMLDAADRPGEQLQRLMPQRAVYAMGGPGSSLLDYAQRLRWAAQQFGVRDFVLLLEPGDVRQTLCNSGNVHSRCLQPASLAPTVQRQPAAQGAKRWLRHSALAQYLFSQIRLDAGRLLRATFSRQTPEAASALAAPGALRVATESEVRAARQLIDAAVAEFARVLAPHRGGRLVLLLDGQRDGRPSPASDGRFERAYLVAQLRAIGAEVIDLEPRYAAHRAASPLKLEVGPYDGHLNRLGVAIAMQAAAQALQ